MQSHSGKKDGAIEVNEPYFDIICQSLPISKEVRARQKSMNNKHFEAFFYIFEKLRELRYEPNSDKRYELLFNIIEMGNFVDAMNLTEGQHEFFKTIKHYRNIISDGFHAFSKDTADDVIHEFHLLLVNYNGADALVKFKDSFQRIARGENTYQLIVEGGQDQKNLKLLKLLSQMKYFFEKSKNFSMRNNLDTASISYIAGANCARDFTRFYCENEKRTRRLNSLSLTECIALFSERDSAHVRELLLN